MVKNRIIAVFVFLCLTVPSINAQDVKAVLKADSSAYLIGDHINLKLQITHPKNVKLLAAQFSDTAFGKLELLETGRDTVFTAGGKQILERMYVAAGFDSLDVVIPPQAITYTSAGDTSLKTVYTNLLKLTVRTIAVDTTQEIKDIKKPIELPESRLIWILIGAGVIVLALAAWYFYRRYKKKRSEQPVPVPVITKTYYEIAYESLKALEKKELWQKGMIKEYHSEITEIIRKYFEERFSLPALELTTGETLANLRNLNQSQSLIEITESFLNNADMVKFAKFQPVAAINEEMLRQAYLILEVTKPGGGAA